MPRQSDLRYTFQPLRGDPFEVVSFTLEEGLSQPFKLELELVSHHPAIDFYRMLDLAAVFTIWRDDTPVRYVHGLVSLFQQGDTGFRRTRYTAVVEPTLKRFDLRSDWRIFQAQTVPDIITSMLAEQKLTDIRSEICFEHQPREYCVQAGETDLDFIARLAAEEGLLYTFEHRADGHTLVLTDRVGGLGTIGTHTDCPVIYQPMSGGDALEPALTRFHYTEQVRTARQVQRDYTFTHPRYNQQHTATGDPASTAHRSPRWLGLRGKRSIAMNGAESRCSSRGIARTKTTTTAPAGSASPKAGPGRPGAPWRSRVWVRS